MIGLKDKVVLITGASRGIGRAAALIFSRYGARVAVNYHQQEQAAREAEDAAASSSKAAPTA